MGQVMPEKESESKQKYESRGVLSEAEFNQQKKRYLAERRRYRSLMHLGFAAALALTLLLLLLAVLFNW